MLVVRDQTAPVRTSRFRFRDPLLLFTRLRLYPDRLELGGWHFLGRYRRAVALAHILQADAAGDDGLLLWLSDGEVLRLRVEGAPAWQAAIALQQQRQRDAFTPEATPKGIQ